MSHSLKRLLLESAETGYFAGFLPLRFTTLHLFLTPGPLALYSCGLVATLFLLRGAEFISHRAPELYDYAVTAGEWEELLDS